MEFNLAQVHEAVERAVPGRDCVVAGDRRLSYARVGARSRRLANALIERGLGAVEPRSGLPGHLSGQDHLAIFLHDGPEYLEAMLGAYKARVAPFNVNHRYVAEELRYVLDDAGARAIVYQSSLADVVAEVAGSLPRLEVRWQVADASGAELAEGAEWFEDVLAASSEELPEELVRSWSPDDLYVLYTGGTTGMPKGVLWRQGDAFVAAMGGRRLEDGREWVSLDQLAHHAVEGGTRVMPAPPFMHGAAQWMAFSAFANGATVVLADPPERFDPLSTLRTIERERVEYLLIVGDAFGRPLADAAERHDTDLSSLLVLINGGATLSARTKARLLAAAPTALLLDGLGASETGSQASHLSSRGGQVTSGTFEPGPGTCLLSSDLARVLRPGEPELGWLAQQGRVPLGYLGDPAKTAATFPTVHGRRHAVPGDRARLREDGSIELLGRDAATINSGGEKVFAEEVEQALLGHPAVLDCVVAGRASDRWGEEVVAIVQLADPDVSDDELLDEAGRHVARYKLPKEIVRSERIRRSPSGKADYRWAAEVARDGGGSGSSAGRP